MTSIIGAINNTFEIFGIEIHWYGVILTSGMILAFLLFLGLAHLKKIEVDFSLTMFLLAITFAVVGARLAYVVPRAAEYDYFITWNGLWRAISISEGGLTIMGGIPAGALGIYIACRIYKKSIFRILDIVIPCLLLGQIVGRWGNIVNSELFGVEITNEAFQKFPFAMWIQGKGVPNGWYAAIPFYEMMINLFGLAMMLGLMFTLKDKLKVGVLSSIYIVWYGLVRGILEIWKIGNLMWGNIGAIQLICYILVPIGIVLVLLIQFGFIKLETPMMYEKHFKVVHEPPAYVDPDAVSIPDSIDDENSFNKVNDEISDITIIKNYGDDESDED